MFNSSFKNHVKVDSPCFGTESHPALTGNIVSIPTGAGEVLSRRSWVSVSPSSPPPSLSVQTGLTVTGLRHACLLARYYY